MTKLNKKYAGVWLPVLLTLVTIFMAWDVGRAEAGDSAIPADLRLEQTFRPGPGQSVGQVQRLQGKSVVQHERADHGYLVSEGLALYNGDTLYTAADGHLELTLNDGSNLVLGAGTQIVINKSIYDPGTKSRLSFFEMVSGKARFMVKKMADYKHSQFNVKTESSVVGVRGSDFVVEIRQEGNKVVITAGGNTILEIFDPANPLLAPVVVTSFQQLITVLGQIMGHPVDITEEEFMKLVQLFGLFLTGGGPGAGPGGYGGYGGGFIPHGGSMQFLSGGFFMPSFNFFLPLLPPIFGPGPDDPFNKDPGFGIRPPLIPELPGLPDQPANQP